MTFNITPNDGSFLGARKSIAKRDAKIKAEFDKAWQAQKDLLKKSVVKLYKDKATISLQWRTACYWDDSLLIPPERIKKSLNQLGRGKFPHTADSVSRAVAIAEEIDRKIKAGSFSWKDYPQWLPDEFKPLIEEKTKQKTIAEWIEEYEKNYWSTRTKDKTSKQRHRDEENWKHGYLKYFKHIPDWSNFPNKELFDKTCSSWQMSWKRNECCTRIKALAIFCGLIDYDNKQFRITRKQVKVRAKPKRRLTDKEIEEWYNKFSQWQGKENSESEWKLWQWMFGMQATYGFRNHEVFNIFNMTERHLGQDGQWYEPFVDAIANPRATIYTEGKAVERSAFLPQPRRWLNEFNLRQPPKEYFDFIAEISKLNEYEQAKKKQNKNHTYINFLLKHEFTFTAYNLRHAWNVKSHNLGIPVSLIIKNLGHSLLENDRTYLESQDLLSSLDSLEKWEERQANKQNEEISLEEQVMLLRQENDQLKALIQSLLESLKKEGFQKEEE